MDRDPARRHEEHVLPFNNEERRTRWVRRIGTSWQLVRVVVQALDWLSRWL